MLPAAAAVATRNHSPLELLILLPDLWSFKLTVVAAAAVATRNLSFQGRHLPRAANGGWQAAQDPERIPRGEGAHEQHSARIGPEHVIRGEGAHEAALCSH